MMMLHDIIKELENTPGTNDKQSILKANHDNPYLKEFFYLALNPHLLFGIKKIPDYSTEHQEMFLNEAFQELYRFANREITGNDAIARLRWILSSVSQWNADLIERVIKKDPNCGISYKLVNKVWKNLIPVTPYMRCSSAVQKNFDRIHFPAMVQKKANGLFLNLICLNGEVIVESRNGKVLELHGCLDKDVLALLQDRNFVIHGEGLVQDGHGGFLDRNTGNGIINKAIQGTISKEEAALIAVECWDVVKYDHWVSGVSDCTYDKRFSMLETMIKLAKSEKLLVIDTATVMNFDEANMFYKDMLSKGEEGAVLKNLDGIWKDHTSPNQVKMKVKDPADLLCVGTQPHSKKPDWIGALILESSDGIIKVSSGSGLTDDLRQKSPDFFIGKIIEVEYNEISEDKKTGQKSLFLPIYIDVREDKSEADSYETILERSSVK